MEQPAEKLNWPTRMELAAKSLFAHNEEEREIATRLLKVAPAQKHPENPFSLLARLFPAGSEAERLLLQTPEGAAIQELVGSLPMERQSEIEAVDDGNESGDNVTTCEPEAVEPAPDPPQPEPVRGDDLEAKMRLLNRLDHQSPVQEWKPKWVQAKPTPPSDDFGLQPIL
jgi:hypothetical protein